MDKSAITRKYQELCNVPSDINELLPYLKYYASKCKSVTEMGIRTPTSTYAFLAADIEKLVSYDIFRSDQVSEVEALAPGAFSFILQDVLQAEIEQTDFLFIDTYHTATQLEKELERHAAKANKYIGFHDTATFWETGEEPYPGMTTDLACGRGLKHAIIPFLKKGGWKVAFMTDKNNGLLIIEKSRVMARSLSNIRYNLFFGLRYLKQRLRNLAHKLNLTKS